MPVPVKLLLVEDSADDAEMILHELRRAGFAPEYQRVETEAEFLAALTVPPQLVISDYSMPQFNGLKAAQLLRALHAEIPFILVSGTVGEDEPAVRRLVRSVFERHGYQVIEAESGKAALALWRENGVKIDLMLTDMVMPDGITGLMLAQQLRQEQPELKIIFSSGYSPELGAQNLSLPAGSHYLQKPFNPQVLLQTVRDCLDAEK